MAWQPGYTISDEEDAAINAAIEADPEERRMRDARAAGKTRPIPLERLRRMGMTLAVARREAREAAAGSDADQTA